ncbi:MAG TPA: hypothetical protein VLI54_02815 [Bacillota bacterium]|nr:hypothetical protein [Bacillota bacterium]
MSQKIIAFMRKNWWLAAVALPVVFMLGVVVHYVANIPQWDEIEIVSLFQKHDAHTLGIADFWHQHNEHRIFFPNVIMYTVAFATRWNVAAEVMMSFVLACVTLVLFVSLVWRTIKARPLRIAMSIFIAFLLFSPMQGENWLWGWQFEWYLTVCALIATVWSLCAWPERWNPRLRMPVAIAAALIATYSLGSGPFVWIIGFVVLLLRQETRRKLVVWGAAAVPALALYYYGYDFHGDQASKTIVTHQPHKFVEYVATYLGHAFASNKYVAGAVGLIFFCLVGWIIYMIVRKLDRGRAAAGWASLAVFGLLAASSTALGRLEFGIAQAMAPRYMIMASLFAIGLVGCLTIIAENYWRGKQALKWMTLVLAMLTLVVIYNYHAGMQIVRGVSVHYRWIQMCAHADQPTEWCLMNVFPDTTHAQQSIDYLKAKHWGGF